MTRFARSKGSKASNERAPEDSTPWAVMKEQLSRAKQDAEHARLREQAEKQRLENYENFLNERKTAKRKSTWCEFPPDNLPREPVRASVQPDHGGQRDTAARPSKKRKNKKPQNNFFNNESENANNNIALENTKSDEVPKRKKKKSHTSIDNNESENAGQNIAVENTNPETGVPKRKKKKSYKSLENNESENADQNIAVENTKSEAGVPRKKKKKSKNESLEEPRKVDTAHSWTDSGEKVSKKKKKSKRKNTEVDETHNASHSSHPTGNPHSVQDDSNKKNKNKNDNPSNVQLNQASSKQKKKKANLEHARRKPEDDHSFQLIINGRSVELVRYDGFPVMRRDAERLAELKRSMVGKGIAKSEVLRTMKLERRRAEKALARLKRDVCYNCRKGGHNLSDCPDLKGHLGVVEGAADGVCFKCGSTEHRQFECKVQRTQEFRFASCFICKEQGHIARQCPDNPKGLYPNGGGCKLCGDVTHLRKDCPTTKSDKEEAAVRLDTLTATDDVEGISQPATTAAAAAAAHRPADKAPKKIKF